MTNVTINNISDGTTADASDINTPLNTIVDAINGNLDNDNIKAGAGIDGSKLADNSISSGKLAAGAVLLGSSKKTSSQGSITTTETDVTSLTVTANVPTGGRSVKVTCFASVTSTVLNDAIKMRFYEDSTLIGSSQVIQVGGVGYTQQINFVMTTTPTAGSHTYKATVFRNAGTGTISVNGSSTEPSIILVEAV